jgi:hypothetical protein
MSEFAKMLFMECPDHEVGLFTYNLNPGSNASGKAGVYIVIDNRFRRKAPLTSTMMRDTIAAFKVGNVPFPPAVDNPISRMTIRQVVEASQ